MTLDLPAIGVLAAAALLQALLPTARARRWFLFAGSVLAIYWLQPALRLRYADFLFPTATLALTGATWWRTRPAPPETGDPHARDNRIAALLLLLIVVGLSGFRYVDDAWRLTAGRPPAPFWVLPGLLLAVGIYAAVARLERRLPLRTVLTIGSGILALLLIALKSEPIAAALSGAWRGAAGQDVSLAAGVDLGWLGFSYVAFRLIHTLRERQLDRLPALALRDYVTYVIFAPAFIAGPIDRVERFGDDLARLADGRGLPAGRVLEALQRIAQGLLKKFVLADTLALGASLSAANVGAVEGPAGLWLLLYGYALRLYFDFGGYTDIAIGLGLLFGIRLPENFSRPYLRSNLATFWQSWHATLSSWVRFYVFTPLSRALLRRQPRPVAGPDSCSWRIRRRC